MKFFTVTLIVMMICGSVFGDRLTTDSPSQEFFGILLDDDSASPLVTFAVVEGLGEFEVRRFERKTVRSVLLTIDQEKIASLRFDDLKTVRDVGEELAGVPGDAACRSLAKRLFQLLIFHGNKTSGSEGIVESACRNLIQLADSEAERAMFKKIGVVYSGLESKSSGLRHDMINEPARETLLKLVQSIRQGKAGEALSVFSALESNTQIPNAWKETLRRAVSSEVVDNRTLLFLLQIELELFVDSDKNVPKNGVAWVAEDTIKVMTPLIRIEQLVEFDLNATQFKDGRWLRPDASGSDRKNVGNSK